LVISILKNIAKQTNPVFASYRGLNHAHWKLWRNAVAAHGATRSRFLALQKTLECEGSQESKRIARDIWNILVSKY